MDSQDASVRSRLERIVMPFRASLRERLAHHQAVAAPYMRADEDTKEAMRMKGLTPYRAACMAIELQDVIRELDTLITAEIALKVDATSFVVGGAV